MRPDYKVYKNKEEALANVLKKRGWCAFTAMMTPIFGLCIIVLDTSRNIKLILFAFLVSLLFYIISMLCIKIGYSKYLSTFVHNNYTMPNMLTCGYIEVSFMIVSIYSFVITKSYCFIFFISILLLVVGIHLWNKVGNFTKNNFNYLYCMINNKVIFYHYNFTEKIERSISRKYYPLCFIFLIFAIVNGLSMRAFEYPSGYALSMGFGLLGLLFTVYPYFIYSAYFLIFVHPHVAKTFNQPILSDYFGFFETDTQLAENFFGANPVKRPIRYEEVFPQKKNA